MSVMWNLTLVASKITVRLHDIATIVVVPCEQSSVNMLRIELVILHCLRKPFNIALTRCIVLALASLQSNVNELNTHCFDCSFMHFTIFLCTLSSVV